MSYRDFFALQVVLPVITGLLAGIILRFVPPIRFLSIPRRILIGAAFIVFVTGICFYFVPGKDEKEVLVLAGTVVDSNTGEGIGRAQISAVGRSETCVSEDTGNFELRIARGTEAIQQVRLRVYKKGYNQFDLTSPLPSRDFTVLLRRLDGPQQANLGQPSSMISENDPKLKEQKRKDERSVDSTEPSSQKGSISQSAGSPVLLSPGDGKGEPSAKDLSGPTGRRVEPVQTTTADDFVLSLQSCFLWKQGNYILCEFTVKNRVSENREFCVLTNGSRASQIIESTGTIYRTSRAKVGDVAGNPEAMQICRDFKPNEIAPAYLRFDGVSPDTSGVSILRIGFSRKKAGFLPQVFATFSQVALEIRYW
jgi:hypothetical protein